MTKRRGASLTNAHNARKSENKVRFRIYHLMRQSGAGEDFFRDPIYQNITARRGLSYRVRLILLYSLVAAIFLQK